MTTASKSKMFNDYVLHGGPFNSERLLEFPESDEHHMLMYGAGATVPTSIAIYKRQVFEALPGSDGWISYRWVKTIPFVAKGKV